MLKVWLKAENNLKLILGLRDYSILGLYDYNITLVFLFGFFNRLRSFLLSYK